VLAKLSGFVLVASSAACSGEPFRAGDGKQDLSGTAGAAAGGSTSGSGGADTKDGGRAGSGGEAGATPAGGTGGGASASFPMTALLDDFDREDGSPGQSWAGALDRFEIHEQRLVDKGSDGAPLVWSEAFGPNQEVFATLHAFGEEQAEINLLLKVQDPYSSCNLMQVLYEPVQSEVEVQFCSGNKWTYAGTVRLELKPGDRLGARTYADGHTKVYVNAEAVLTVEASAFQYRAVGGRIGVNSLGDSCYDDFGGGDIPPRK
jgi:hypothetical protein